MSKPLLQDPRGACICLEVFEKIDAQKFTICKSGFLSFIIRLFLNNFLIRIFWAARFLIEQKSLQLISQKPSNEISIILTGQLCKDLKNRTFRKACWNHAIMLLPVKIQRGF